MSGIHAKHENQYKRCSKPQMKSNIISKKDYCNRLNYVHFNLSSWLKSIIIKNGYSFLDTQLIENIF